MLSSTSHHAFNNMKHPDRIHLFFWGKQHLPHSHVMGFLNEMRFHCLMNHPFSDSTM